MTHGVRVGLLTILPTATVALAVAGYCTGYAWPVALTFARLFVTEPNELDVFG